MEKTLGGKVKTKYVENVPEGADAERVIRELAQSGNKIDLHDDVRLHEPDDQGRASSFPNVDFKHATGYKTATNVGTTTRASTKAATSTGIVAGKMTKTNIVGYVAAFPIPEVVMGINAFARGMRSVNPKAEVSVIWVNSWFDPGNEREAAKTLIVAGRRRPDAPHRLDRRRAGRRGEGQVTRSPITPTCRNTARRRSSPP